MEHLVPWLTLKNVSGIGNLMYRRLIERVGSPDKVLQAPMTVLRQIPGLSKSAAAAIVAGPNEDDALQEIEKCRARGFHIITQQDDDYPVLLLQIPDPPPILYCHGTISGDDGHIAVVGSRKATTYGKTSARNLCRELSGRGLTVVSGMALGIDTAAHVGALSGGGRTIAVLGSGLDRIYPTNNRKLFHRISENGAVLSEFSLNAAPRPYHFPQRNRIISGMALGTVVVEAGNRSGSLITARLAAEQGREVFAVPGSIHAATSRGTHHLIKQGAKLVENWKDIVEEIATHLERIETPVNIVNERKSADATTTPLAKIEMQLMDALPPYPVHIDELARQCKCEIGVLTAALCQLELRGAAQQEPGKYFYRTSNGTDKAS